MKVKNIYNKLDKLEDSFEAKLDYLMARKDLTMISHMVNEYHDEYVFEGTDGYITIDKALKNPRINFEYGWSTKVVIVVDGKVVALSKEWYLWCST